MTDNTPARSNTSAVALRDEQTEFDTAQVAVLRSLGVGENASREDLAVFFHVARRTGLDPFARQLYLIERWTKDGPRQTIQTGIDGFRLVAQRTTRDTGQTLSYDDTQWCGPDGVWVDVWLADEPPRAARVTVLRDGARFPAVALFREYAQTTRQGEPTAMWRDKGALMLAKCAEALALRKAFPLDLSGVYTTDELARDDRPTAPAAEPSLSAAAFTTPPPAADEPPVDPDTGEVLEGDVVEEAGQ